MISAAERVRGAPCRATSSSSDKLEVGVCGMTFGTLSSGRRMRLGLLMLVWQNLSRLTVEYAAFRLRMKEN